jgi:hypothetical protein
VWRKLKADKLPVIGFLLLMEENGLFECDRAEIRAGNKSIRDMHDESLHQALINWPEVLKSLKPEAEK